jgi:hypothetical protein
MSAVIEVLGLANGSPLHMTLPCWIQEFTPEAGLTLTSKREDAQRFETTVDAWDFYRTELPQGIHGFNPAGPNRPLTAFTVTIYDPEIL